MNKFDSLLKSVYAAMRFARDGYALFDFPSDPNTEIANVYAVKE